MAKRVKLLSFYIVTFEKEGEKTKKADCNGIQEAYVKASKKVKQLKGEGATLHREGTRGSGRYWVGMIDDKQIKVSIQREKREVKDE